MMKKPFYVYVDVDETFLRNYGTKQMPIPSVIEHVKALKEEGAILYCWSSGGAEYAQQSAEKFGIDASVAFQVVNNLNKQVHLAENNAACRLEFINS